MLAIRETRYNKSIIIGCLPTMHQVSRGQQRQVLEMGPATFAQTLFYVVGNIHNLKPLKHCLL